MEPVSMGIAAAGAALSAIFGLIGNLVAEGKYAEAEALRQRAVAQYGADKVPPMETFVARSLSSGFESLREDAGLRGSQLEALRRLEEEAGGETAGDRAALALAANAGEMAAQGQLAGAERAMAQRGGAPVGLRYALQAGAGQSAANAAADATLQAAVAAQQKRLRALESSAGLAGAVRGDDYRASSDRASAADALNRFNEGMRMDAARFAASESQRRFVNAGEAVDRVAPGRESRRQADAARETWGGLGEGVARGTSSVASSMDQQATQDELRRLRERLGRGG